MTVKKVLAAILIIIFLIGFSLVVLEAQPKLPKSKARIIRLRVQVISANNRTLTVQARNRTGKLFAAGKWIVISGGERESLDWSEVRNFIKVGENATIAFTIMRRNNRTIPILLALKQGNVRLVRYIPRRSLSLLISKRVRADFKAIVMNASERGILAKVGNRSVFIIMAGRWIKAGEGSTSWSEVRGLFSPGDKIWVYGRMIILKRSLKGIRAIVVPKTVINLDTGVSLIREQLKR